MLYELRIYDTMPGKLPALNDRFANHTVGFFNKYDIGMVGFWTAEIGASNQLTYIVSFDSMADREKKWNAFGADPGWREVRAETEKEGAYNVRVTNSFMSLTPYSMEPHIASKVQELRVYDAVPGKLPALHDRFSNHTIKLFEKHGIENVAYWTEDVGTSNRLVYMVGHEGLGQREKSWAAFRADSEWQKAQAESEKNGALTVQTRSSILRLTPYSPR